MISNPYKPLTGDPPPLKKLSTFVSESDWLYLYGHCPDHGFQDALLSSLFQSLITALRSSSISFPSSPHDYPITREQLGTLIQGCSFPSTLR